MFQYHHEQEQVRKHLQVQVPQQLKKVAGGSGVYGASSWPSKLGLNGEVLGDSFVIGLTENGKA